MFRKEAGAELAGNSHRFVSRLAASGLQAYPPARQAAMTGQAGGHTNRSELVAVHGYDAKYAMQFLTTGRITLEVSDTADTPGLSGMGFPRGLRGGP